jgi:hypothetical protein
MKKGGFKNVAYADQFNLLSPCYGKDETVAGFHAGGDSKVTKKAPKKAPKKDPKKTPKKALKKGGSCYSTPSVSEMGIIDTPASMNLSDSENAWNHRMSGGSDGITAGVTTDVMTGVNPSLLGKLPNDNPILPDQRKNMPKPVIDYSNVNKSNANYTKFSQLFLPTDINVVKVIIEKTDNENNKYKILIIKKDGDKLSKKEFTDKEYHDISRILSEVYPRVRSTLNFRKKVNY